MPKHFCSLIQYILTEYILYARHVPRMREKAVNKTNLVFILIFYTFEVLTSLPFTKNDFLLILNYLLNLSVYRVTAKNWG